MTVYHYKPEIVDSYTWDLLFAESGDPVRQVAAILLFPNGNIFYGWNNLQGLSSRTGTVADYIWKTNRNLGRILATHAEQSVILNAVLGGVQDFSEAVLIVTLEPCSRCRELIEVTGIKEVFYYEKYTQSGS